MSKKSESDWRKELNPNEFHILREKGTERPFSGDYWNTFEDGIYRCRGCGQELFAADTKFDAGCGWPSFFAQIRPEAINTHEDRSHGMVRTEITCSKCGGHIGHVFDDGPEPTGLRYCANSASLKLVKPEKK